MRRRILELHDTTARAYGAKTLDEYARAAALEKAAKTEITALAEDARPVPTSRITRRTND